MYFKIEYNVKDSGFVGTVETIKKFWYSLIFSFYKIKLHSLVVLWLSWFVYGGVFCTNFK